MVAVIGLNCLALRPNGGGVHTYGREVLVRLPSALTAHFVAQVQADVIGLVPAGVHPVIVRPCDGLRRALEGLRGMGACDLVHGLDVDLPLRPGAATVATVHDLSVFDVPWAFPRKRVIGERVIVSQALRRADALIANSAFTAERVRARFGRVATVIPLAPATEFGPVSEEGVLAVRQRYRLPERFVLHVGTVEPRKDVPTLAAACASLSVPLVLAGALRDGTAPRGTVTLGYVPRGDLPALYASAVVVAYTSRYEGFGLPPLEAMACGAPVVATRVGALPAVLGDSAQFVPVADVDAFVAAIGDLMADPDRRAELGAHGQRQAQQYSWDATAAATADVYRSLGVSG